MTGNFGTATPGIRKAIGYYDFEDGIRFEQGIDGVVSLVLRTSTSGTPVDDYIPQSLWNIDVMDGSGISGITVDWTKTQIFEFDLQWLGAGRIRCYLNVNGHVYEVHEFLHANVLDVVYMQTPHLHCTYEIENVSAVAGDTLDQICSSVFTEGDDLESQVKHATSNETTGVVVASGVNSHILSIRPAQLFKGQKNKGMIIPIAIEVFVSGNNSAHFHIIEDAEITGTWDPHGHGNSMIEEIIGLGGVYTIGTGHTRDEGYASSSKSGAGASESTDRTYRIQIDPAGHPDTLTIVGAGLGGAAVMYGKVVYEERY